MKLRRNHLCPIRRLRAMPTCLASTILSASTGVVIVTVTISCLKRGNLAPRYQLCGLAQKFPQNLRRGTRRTFSVHKRVTCKDADAKSREGFQYKSEGNP